MISSGKAISPLKEIVNSINTEISTLSSTDATDEIKSKIATLRKDLSILASVSELDLKIQALTVERKSLQGQGLRDKHWNTGSALLGVGVGVSVLGE